MQTLLYIADPLCSWCYGFRDEITKLKDHYSEELGFSLIMGGLRPGGGEEWNDSFKNMLRHHWEQVQERSGQPFNYDLLSWDHFNYDTEPPCRAVRVVRDLAFGREFDFFKAVQSAFYAENKDTNQLESYRAICDQLEIPFAEFSDLFLSEEYRDKAREDFQFSAALGVRGFPSVVFRAGDRYGVVTRGYTGFERMKASVERFREMVG